MTQTSETEKTNPTVLVKAYGDFAGMKPERVEEYLTNQIRVPARTERFNWEDYELDGPVFSKIRSLGASMKSYLFAMALQMTGLAVIIAVIVAMLGGSAVTVALGCSLYLAAIAAGGWYGLSRYNRNLALVESDLLVSALFKDNLKKWAVSRYDFASVEDFMETLEGKGEQHCYLNKEDSNKNGLIVSSLTGNEWRLKPDLA